VRVSFLEIYNEELIDLLGADSVENPRLKIYEDNLRKVLMLYCELVKELEYFLFIFTPDYYLLPSKLVWSWAPACYDPGLYTCIIANNH